MFPHPIFATSQMPRFKQKRKTGSNQRGAVYFAEASHREVQGAHAPMLNPILSAGLILIEM